MYYGDIYYKHTSYLGSVDVIWGDAQRFAVWSPTAEINNQKAWKPGGEIQEEGKTRLWVMLRHKNQYLKSLEALQRQLQIIHYN